MARIADERRKSAAPLNVSQMYTLARIQMDRQQQLANQRPGQGMQTNTSQSTAQMQQQRSRNPNAGQTREPQQQMLGNVGFDFLGGFDPQHQNGNLVQETGQIGIPLNIQQARGRDDYWETYPRKQNSKEFDLAVKTGPDGAKAREAASLSTLKLAPLRWNASETLHTKLIPLAEAVHGLQGLGELESGLWGGSELKGHTKLSWKEHITAMDEVVVEGPFTDSGYASILKTNMPGDDPPLPDKPRCPIDDKSYVTMGDEDIEDVKTVYSAATSIDLPQSQQYIIELCADIFSELENHFDSTNWNTLETALPSLIKAFAIKIGHDSSAQVNQDIMYFIHKQHK